MWSLLCLGILLPLVSCTTSIRKKEGLEQPPRIPRKVLAAFHKRHQGSVPRIKREEFNDRVIYEVLFDENGLKKSESFTKEGYLVELEEETLDRDIDPVLLKKFQSQFLADDPAYEIIHIDKVQSKDFEGFEFKVKTQKSRTGLMEYLFRRNGDFYQAEETQEEKQSTPTP